LELSRACEDLVVLFVRTVPASPAPQSLSPSKSKASLPQPEGFTYFESVCRLQRLPGSTCAHFQLLPPRFLLNGHDEQFGRDGRGRRGHHFPRRPRCRRPDRSAGLDAGPLCRFEECGEGAPLFKAGRGSAAFLRACRKSPRRGHRGWRLRHVSQRLRLCNHDLAHFVERRRWRSSKARSHGDDNGNTSLIPARTRNC